MSSHLSNIESFVRPNLEVKHRWEEIGDHETHLEVTVSNTIGGHTPHPASRRVGKSSKACEEAREKLSINVE